MPAETPLNIAFSTLACPNWSWETILARSSEFGYDGVEIRLIQGETDLLKRPEFAPGCLKQRLAELARAKQTVCGLASSVRFDYPLETERAEQARIGKGYVDLAVALGAGFVRVFGDVVPPADESQARAAAIDRIATGLSDVGEYALLHGIDLLIETHGDFTDTRLLADLMGRVACPAVGVLWDTHHPWRFCREPLSETFARLSRWIRHTHWKDSVQHDPARVAGSGESEAAQQAKSLMSGHRSGDYVLFGHGEFPAAECMNLLLKSGYTGWFSYEWEKAWHPQIEPPEEALPGFPAALRQLANKQ
jgi:sugar phosphate isomerase/epimerase